MSAPRFIRALLVWCAGMVCGAAVQAAEAVGTPTQGAETVTAVESAQAPARVVVIPVRDEIAKPILYVIRRGLKQAIEEKADLVLLDMKTPGGSLGVTFEILEALEKFDGETATYVNNEALSAGSFISAMTDDIYFTPDGVIGAAAPVMSGGKDIDETMKLKIVSYLKARIRAISEGHGYRGQVISAMIDADYELKIGDEVLKEKGELLSLTATEASKDYGDPAAPLLAAGIAKSVDDLLQQRYGARGYTVETLQTNWSEDLAAMLNAVSPILMGLGFLGLFIEFKTPGFGLFGVLGGMLLLVVFFGHYVAGLSGHEPALFFLLGVVLILTELFFLPGTVVMALAGVFLMMGSLLWSMADIWPNQPVEFTGDVFTGPLNQLGLSLLISAGLIVALWRFMPKGWFFNRIALIGASLSTADGREMPLAPRLAPDPLIGRRGRAVTALFPSGKVEIDGVHHEAQVAVGNVDEGTEVVVIGRTAFGLVVERSAS